MSDTLYDEDVLAWSEQQAAALRARAGANALDYDNLAEEIEDVGKSILHACESEIENILEHLLKIELVGTPDDLRGWRREIRGFRRNLERRLTPTIRNRLIERLDPLNRRAIKDVTEDYDLPRPLDGPTYSWEQIVDPDWYPEPRQG